MMTIIKYSLCSVATVLLSLWYFCLPDDLFEGVSYSTVVEDSSGRLLGARIAEDGQWRFPVCDTLPEKFVTALIEFEDRNFYSHDGVSLKSLARAFWQNISNRRIVSGGSTISMQVIRLSRRGERTLWNKVVECFLATRLETLYSKEEILRMYVSHAPFGGNVVGIDAAMWRYLGSHDSEMSWAEAATLAVMQNSPSTVTLSKNREALLAKRNRLLVRLHQSGHITQEECALSLDEPLIEEPYAMPQHAVHLVDWHNMHDHGKTVRTSVDIDLQMQVEELTTRWNKELRLSGANDLATVIIDVKTAQVVAYCGNADMDYDREGKWVDIARSPRSSGSILKPVLYCSALAQGQILPSTLLRDIPTDFGGFAPKNYNGAFSGAVPADEAIAQSLNVPCVDMLRTYGVIRFVELLQDCGLSTLNRPASSYGLSVALGGAEVTLLEMTSLYAMMSAAYQSEADHEFPLHDKVALYDTFDAMRNVNRPDQLDWKRVNSVQNIAWKTGTSYGSRDAWAIGLTPDYAVGVWVGNADGSSTPDLTGARTAGPVMFDLMNLLPYSEWFDQPDAEDGAELLICRHSGHRAGRYCTHTVTRTCSVSAVSSPHCPYCHPVHFSHDGKHQIANVFSLPPEIEHYYKPLHPEYTPLTPASHSYRSTMDIDMKMKLMYPEDGSMITLPRQLDGTRSSLTCTAAHSDPGMELFWHCDGNFLGVTRDIHSIQFSLQPGTHEITVVDSDGDAVKSSVVIK